MQVRAATVADVPALLALDRDAPTASHWSEAAYRRLFTEAAGRVVLVAEDQSVQGFIIGRDLGVEWEIENIVVATPAQRRGLGERLVCELLNRVRTLGARAVFLEVRESNRAARALYSKVGFETGRRKSYYRNPEEDAILYKKIVTARTPESC